MAVRNRKNPHAVALGRLGGKATKGISTPAKRRAAVKGAYARWAQPVPESLRHYFRRESDMGYKLTPMQMANALYTRAPHLLPKAVDKRTALRFANSAKNPIERTARLAQIKALYEA